MHVQYMYTCSLHRLHESWASSHCFSRVIIKRSSNLAAVDISFNVAWSESNLFLFLFLQCQRHNSREASESSALPSLSGAIVTMSRMELGELIASSVQRAPSQKQNTPLESRVSEGE